MHLEQTGNTFLLTWTGVEDIRASFNLTRVDTEECQTTYIRVSSDLECQSCSLLIFIRLTVFFSTGSRVCTHNIRSIQRRRQESTYIVQQCLYTLILEWRTAQHRNNLHLQCTGTQSTQNFLISNSWRIIEIFLHQRFIEFSNFLQHLVTPFLSFINQVCRDVIDFIVGTHSLIMPVDSLHLNQVNQSLEIFLRTDRNDNRTRVSAQNVLHLTYYFKEVGTRTVHLIYITDTWNIILVSLTPYSFWLRFYTTYRTISCNSTIQHTQRTFYLSSKIYVSRSIDQVDFILVACIVPISGCGSRSNSNTTFLLLFHPVHRSSTIMNFTDLVSQTSIIQNTFWSSGFTSIDVGHDTDVTGQMQIMFSHFNSFLIIIPD